MQKCISGAYKKRDKNNNKKTEKREMCDGFSCKPVSNLSNAQFKENNTSSQMLNINLLTNEMKKDR